MVNHSMYKKHIQPMKPLNYGNILQIRKTGGLFNYPMDTIKPSTVTLRKMKNGTTLLDVKQLKALNLL